MPALFAYLIAVGILLGGGYGALTWLAAPEPVKVVAKVKPKQVPHPDYEGGSEAGSSVARASAASAPSANDGDHAASAANVPPPPDTNVAASEQRARDEASRLVQDQQNRSASAESRTAETQPAPATEQQPGQAAEQAAQARSPPSVSPSIQQTAAAPPSPAARTTKRQHLRQANGREKPALALMTLRTIEFPDGRRVTQLIPYRGHEPALAFQPDE